MTRGRARGRSWPPPVAGAHLACMRRPTASTALQRLSREGEVLRRVDGTWLLLGGPPQTPAAALSDRAAA
jgi:hypothetical protein